MLQQFQELDGPRNLPSTKSSRGDARNLPGATSDARNAIENENERVQADLRIAASAAADLAVKGMSGAVAAETPGAGACHHC